jgi:hypothetical protein
VGNTLGAMNQPRFSRDSIAEFEFVSNRFDATQGRSPAAVVNAVSKSGTNTFTGLMSGYFRNSDWNAEDPVLHRRCRSATTSTAWPPAGRSSEIGCTISATSSTTVRR